MKAIIGIVLYLIFGVGAVSSGARWMSHMDDKEEQTK